MERSLGVPEFDSEGRYICVSFGRLTIASIYFQMAVEKNEIIVKCPINSIFINASFLSSKISVKQVQFMLGDYNTAHHEIDLARPKTNKKASGFLMEERQELSRWEEAG